MSEFLGFLRYFRMTCKFLISILLFQRMKLSALCTISILHIFSPRLRSNLWLAWGTCHKVLLSICFCAFMSLVNQMSRLTTKPTKWHVRPAKTQISLGIHPVWSESSLSAWRKLGSLATHWAHSEDSDQTGRMPRLIWVFTGHTVILLVLSWGGSDYMELLLQLLQFSVTYHSLALLAIVSSFGRQLVWKLKLWVSG